MGSVRLMLKTVLPSVIAITMLAGCAGTAPDDDAAIGRWQARQAAATKDDGDLLGVLSGRVGAAESGNTEDVAGRVRMKFESPTELRSVTLWCFGHGTVRGYLSIDEGPTSRSEGVDVRCGAKPRTLRLSQTWRTGVQGVGFSAVAASNDSAWQLTIR